MKHLRPLPTDDEVTQLNHELLPHVVALLLLPHCDAGPTRVIWSGSGTLVDTGTQKILVTCWHVWRRFREIVENCPKARIGMARGADRNIANITELKLIDHHVGLDLAILDASDPDLIAGTSHRFLEFRSWPPARPQVGEYLHAMGFPGCERKTTIDQQDLKFLTCTVADYIVNVGDRNISIADENRDWKVFGDRDALAIDFRMDGISGCPAYAIRDFPELVPELVGFIYEASEALNGIVFAVHADFIKANGKINWSLIPQI